MQRSSWTFGVYLDGVKDLALHGGDGDVHLGHFVGHGRRRVLHRAQILLLAAKNKQTNKQTNHLNDVIAGGKRPIQSRRPPVFLATLFAIKRVSVKRVSKFYFLS